MPDFERPLNKRGKRDAPAMGDRLAKRGDLPDLLISSPAVRALNTARILADALGYPQERIQLAESIYEAPMSALLDVVRQVTEDRRHVMLVGHNPGCEQFAGFLTGKPFARFVTCGVADLELDVPDWQGAGPGVAKVVSYWYPKMFDGD